MKHTSGTGKRFLSTLLILIMTFSMAFENAGPSIAYASETEEAGPTEISEPEITDPEITDPEIADPESEDNLTGESGESVGDLYINGTKVNSSSITLEYGQTWTAEVKTRDGSETLSTNPEISLYENVSDKYPAAQLYSPIGPGGEDETPDSPGTFHIAYQYGSGDESITCKASESNASITITKATIAGPDDVVIGTGSNSVSDKTISWEKPVKSASGKADLLAGTISEYKLDLYRKTKESDIFPTDPIASETVAASDSDPETITSSVLESEFDEYGFYLVKITAVTSNADNYNSSESIESSNIYKVEDETAPIISGFSKDSTDETMLTVTVKDAQSGLGKYAFSTAASIDDVTEWTDASDAQNTASKTSDGAVITFRPTESGTYRFYAYDADGPSGVCNGKTSSNSISVSILTLHNYYVSDALQTGSGAKVAIIGDTAYSLPSQSAAGTRKGYIFDNWYSSYNSGSDTYSDPIASSLTATGSDIDAYAKWDGASINFSYVKANGNAMIADTTNDVQITYGGADAGADSITLTAEAVVSTGDCTVAYNWKKGSEYVWDSSKEDSTLVLSNYSESGTYTCVAFVTDSDGVTRTQESTAKIKAEILKRDLTVTYTGTDSLSFGDAVPELTFSATGFAGTDDISVVSGSLSTTYEQGSAVGTYSIDFSGLTSDNYNIVPVDAAITVSARVLTADDLTVSLAIPDGGYTYDASAKEPETTVTITASDTTLVKDTDYEVAYSDNVKASTSSVNAKAVITFKGNYSSASAMTVEFTIGKAVRAADTKVVRSNWTYKKDHDAISVTSSTLEDSPRITYVYSGTAANGTTYGPSATEPTSAGEYSVYAKLAATSDYEAYTTEAAAFSINPRVLTITSPTKDWEFDGNTHSAATYTMDGQLASGDAIQSIVVSGEVLLVTGEGEEVTNQITVTFDNVTDPYNYQVVKNEGKLSVHQATLPSPSNCRWDTDSQGKAKAAWTGIIRTKVDVAYTVKLYREGVTDPIDTQENVTASEYDFSSIILGKDGSGNYNYDLGQYYFTVSAKAVSGDYSGYYNESSSKYEPGKSEDTTTYDLQVKYGAGISKIKFNNAEYNDGDVIRVFQGQTYPITVTAKKGYSLAATAWAVSDIHGGQASKITIAEPGMNSTSLTVGALDAPSSGDMVCLAAIAEDDIPVITSFTGSNYETEGDEYLQRTYLNISAYDSGEITGYKLWNEADGEPADWTTPVAAQLSNDNTTLTIAKACSSTGTYKFKLKDDYYDSDNDESHVVTAGNTVTINRISFKSGLGASDTQTMNDIIVVQDTSVTLPANTFTNTGYGFKNWRGTTGDVYGNMDKLLVAGDDTLTAVWTDLTMTYTVNYYEMGVDGTYAENESGNYIPTSSKSFETAYNTSLDILDTTNTTIWYSKTGFEADTETTTANNTETSVTMVDNTVTYTFNVFYKRLQYNLVYEYLNPSTGNYETASDDYKFKLYFGETLPAEPAIPTVDGYSFGTSWVYETTGERPTTMPAMDVNVTVSCTAESASYKINYFEQGLPASMLGDPSTNYSLVSSDIVYKNHGTPITYTLATDAPERTGFTATYVSVTTGAPGTSTPDTTALTDTATGTVSKDGIVDSDGNSLYLNINVYYVRNTYNITLSVKRKNLTYTYNATDYDGLVYDYVWEDIPYGYAFTADETKALMEADLDLNGSGDLTTADGNGPAYWDYLTLAQATAASLGDTDETARLEYLTTKEHAQSETEGYILGTFTDWSTGSTPVSMPAGEMSLTRQYILTSQSYFYVDIYLETVVAGSTDGSTVTKFNDEPDYTLSFEGDTGGYAQISDSSTAIDGINTVVDYSKFGDFIDTFTFYEFKEDTNTANGGVLRAQITDTNTDTPNPMHLKVYFDRREAQTTIHYYYIDGVNAQKEFATVTKTGKWGTSYNAEYFALFKDTANKKTSDGTAIVYNDGISDDIKNLDFYTENYVATVSTSYVWTSITGPDMSSNGYGWNGVYTSFVYKSDVTKSHYLYFGKQNNYNAARSTLNGNNVYVYYSLPKTAYYIDLAYNTNGLTALTSSSGNGDVSILGKGDTSNMKLSLSYTGAADVYTYSSVEGDSSACDVTTQESGSFSAIRVGNECSLLKIASTGVNSDSANYYPGAILARGTSYSYYEDRRPASTDYQKITFNARTTYTFTIHVAGLYGTYSPTDGTNAYTYSVTPTADVSYYIKDGCIYMLNTYNNFFVGYRASYSVYGNSYKPSTTKIVESAVWKGADIIGMDYVDLCNNDTTYGNRDQSAEGVYECEEGFGSLPNDPNTTCLTYNCYHYHHSATYPIYYVVGSNSHKDTKEYGAGKTVYLGYDGGTTSGKSVSEYFDPASHPNKEIHWYTDKNYTTPMPESITMPSSTKEYYGRWEKTVLKGTFCEHFELADTLTINGESVRYVTLDNLEAVKAILGSDLTDDSADNKKENLSYINEFGETSTNSYPVITYKYKGNIVLIVHQNPMICFTDVEVSTRTDADLAANFPGFYFDKAYPYNSYIGYCQTDKVDFDLYYARDKYSLSTDYQEHTNNNVTTTATLYGHNVTLEDLTDTRRGYTFEGWKVYEVEEGITELTKDSDGNVTNTLVYSSSRDELKYEMPAKNLYAQAQWTPSNADYPIYYYFAGSEGSYDTELVKEMKTAVDEITAGTEGSLYTSSDITLTTDTVGTTYSGKLLKKSGAAIGAYRTVSISTGTLYIYYAPDGTEGYNLAAGTFYADAVNAIGASVDVSLLSEAEKQISDYYVDYTGRFSDDVFTFSFAGYQKNESLTRKTRDDSFEVDVDMSLGYYYTRSNELTLTLVGISTDGKRSTDETDQTGLTLSGEGTYSYGDKSTLKESHVSTSYTFLGWFSASTITAALNVDGTLDTDKLVDSNNKSLALSTASTYYYRLKSTTTLYAVSKPYGIPEGSITVTSVKGATDTTPTDHTYAYTYGTSNTLKSSLTYTGAGDTTYVNTSKVKWYRIPVDSQGTEGTAELVQESTAANYSMPVGTPVGTYKFYCEYTLTRSDNGRSITVTSDQITVIINSKGATATATGYTGVYDAEYHNIKVTAAAGSTVYYNIGSAVETDASGNVTKGTRADAFEGIKDVKLDSDGNVTAQTVYYYVVDADPNVDPCSGQAEVKITPVTLKITLTANGTFTKIYNGSKNITGADKAKLQDVTSTDFFTISGWVGSDGDNLSAFLLEFDGTTNSRHVTDCSSATLNNLQIAFSGVGSGSGDNPNYNFAAGNEAASIIIPASIDPLDVDLEWKSDTLTYNSDAQAPDFTLKANIPSGDAGTAELTKSMIQVTGQQTNVGEGYTAYATILTAEECSEASITPGDSDYQASDYVIDSSDVKKSYKIVKCPITVTPVAVTTIYNGLTRTKSFSEVQYARQRVVTISGYTFKDNQKISGYARCNEVNAGTYSSYSAQELGIYEYTTSTEPFVDEEGNESTREVQVKQNITENFDITFASGSMTIYPREISISGLDADDKAYDGNTNAVVNISGLSFVDESSAGTQYTGIDAKTYWNLSADALKTLMSGTTIDASKVTMTFENAAVGTDKNVSIAYTHSGDDASILVAKENCENITSNFVVRFAKCQTAANADITGKTVSLSISDQTITYGDDAPVLDSAQYSYALLSGDTNSGWGTLPTLEYVIRMVRDADGNEMSYDSDSDGWVSYSKESTATPAGVYTIKASIPSSYYSGDSPTGNYILTADNTATLTINKKQLGVSAGTSVTKVYDGNINAYGAADLTNGDALVSSGVLNAQCYTLSGVVTGDTVILNMKSTATDGTSIYYNSKDVSSATQVTVKDYELDSNSAKNYYIASTGTSFVLSASTITKRPLLVTADNKTTVYGSEFPVTGSSDTSKIFTVSYGKTKTGQTENAESGFISGEGVSVLTTTGLTFACDYTNAAASDNRHVGTYTITPSGLDADNDSGNYSFEYAAGKLTITKAVITINASGSASVAYGSTIPSSYTLAASGLLLSDAIDSINGNNWSSTADGWKAKVTYKYTSQADNTEYTQTTVKYAPRGNYTVTPIVTGLSSGDYTFAAGTSASISIASPFIEVVGLTAADKEYDATTTVNDIDWAASGLKFYIYNGTYDGTGKSGLTVKTEKTLAQIKALLGSSGVQNSDVLGVTAVFDDANAADDVSVSLQVSPGTLLNGRYQLIYANDSNTTVNDDNTYNDPSAAIKATAVADITQKALTVKVNSSKTSEKYGTLDASSITCTYTYKGLLTSEAALKDNNAWDITIPYSTNDAVGSYTILFTVGDATKAVTDPDHYSATNKGIITGKFKNYLVTLESTTLEITKNIFTTPVASWDTGDIGTINWTRPDQIGNVDVSGYTLWLYKKNGEANTAVDISSCTGYSSTKSAVVISGADTLSYSGFADAIRKAGAGNYVVCVRADSSDTTNVQDSLIATSGTIHASKVTVKPKDDTSAAGLKTNAAQAENTLKFDAGQSIGSSTLEVTNTTSSSSVVMLAGESGIKYSFTIKNALSPKYDGDTPTGYTYKESTSEQSSSISGSVTAALKTGSNDTYEGSVGLTASETVDEIVVCVALTATDPTLKVSITKTVTGDDKIVYGYAANSVKFTASPDVVTGDNVDKDDYTYTYQWYLQKGIKKPQKITTGGSSADYYLEQGLASSSTAYNVFCQVTATRKDNGRSIANTAADEYGDSLSFIVDKAQIKGTVSWSGWTYGQERTNPTLTIEVCGERAAYEYNASGALTAASGSTDILNGRGITVKLQYRLQGTTAWTDYNRVSSPIKDAGTYELQVAMDGGDNFDDFTTPTPTTVTVAQAKYQAVTDLQSEEGSSVSRLGIISWKLPAEIMENNAAAGKVPVWFHVDIHKIALKASGYEGTTLDESIFDQIKEKGLIVNIGAHQASDYIDVTLSDIPNGINISESYLKTNGTVAEDAATGVVSYKYDFSAYMNEPGLYYYEVFAYAGGEGTLETSSAGAVYDTDNVLHSDSSQLPMNHWITVSNNIDVTDGDNEVSTGTGEYTKIYDGKDVILSVHISEGETPFAAYQWYKNGAPITGATASTYKLTYTDESAVYSCRVSDNVHEYDTTTRQVTIKKRPILIETDGASFTYDGLAHGKQTSSDWRVSADLSDASKNMGLAETDAVTAWTLATTVTTVSDGEKENEMTGLEITRTVTEGGTSVTKVVYSQSNAAVNSNYTVTQSEGILKIDNKSVASDTTITFSATDAGSFIYDGTEKEPEITVTYTTAAGTTYTLVKGTDYTLAYTNNIHAGTTTVKPTVTITGIGNYSGTLSKVFTINRRPVTLKSESLPAAGETRYYNGSALTSNSAAVLSDETSGVTDKGLANGDKVTSVTYTGSQLLAGTSSNTYKDVVIKTSDETEDVTADYIITSETGTLTVTAVKIKIKADSASRAYNGSALSVSTCAVVSETGFESLVGADHIDSKTITGSITDVGTVNSVITPGSVVIKNSAGTDVTGGYDITLDTGVLEITPITTEIVVTANSSSKMYDGTALTDSGYTYTGGVLITGDTLSATVSGTITNYTDGGASNDVTAVKVMRGNTDVTADYTFGTHVSGTLSISKRPVTVTSATDSKVFDNTALTNSTVTETITTGSTRGGFITGEGLDYTVTGAQTVVGSSANTFTYVAKAGTLLTNYDITKVEGTLTVSAKGSVVVTITEHSADVVYDGAEHTLSGYDVSISDPLYTAADFSFTGTDTVKGTYKGTYPMQLKASDFANTNTNFTNVTFVIVDGKLTIDPISSPITVTANSTSKVYDATPLTDSGFTYTQGIIVTGDALSAVISGTQTNAGESANRVVSYKVMRGDVDVTANYTFTASATGKLTVSPKPLTADDLTLTTTADLTYPQIRYTGSAVGPGISVDVALGAAATRSTHLTQSTNGRTGDYTITNSAADKKVTTATAVGTYTVEVTGIGNYTGTIYKTYDIVDDGKPVVTGTWKNGTLEIANGGKYCLGAKIKITDPNLISVKITSHPVGDATETVEVDEDVTGSTVKNYTLPGTADGTVYTIVAEDVSHNVNDTMVITVYDSHLFTDYSTDNTKEPDGYVEKAPCDHECGTYDYIIKPAGTVNWDYNYSYSTVEGVQSGIQAVGERETHVLVELYRNGSKIATKIVDCDSECGNSAASPAAVGSADYTFTTYDPSDSSKGSGSSRIPYYDNSGNAYSYELKVTAISMTASGYTKTTTYTVGYSSAPITGGIANVTYNPGCFDVPWTVTLTDLPYTIEADKSKTYSYPSAVYVKVLYAESGDAPDSDYKVITQQQSASDMGVQCSATVAADGTCTYSGTYPVWKYIGGTTKSYYHRIQIVGYDYNGVHVDVSGESYKSICDSDHVNHTVSYDPSNDQATGTIQYELSGLMPTLIFDLNYGKNETHAVLWDGIDAFGNGGTITAEAFNSVAKPKRSGYKFLGWYTARKGGVKVKAPVTLSESGVRIFAHWEEIVKDDDPDPYYEEDTDPTPTPSSDPTPAPVPAPKKEPIPDEESDNTPEPDTTPQVTPAPSTDTTPTPAPAKEPIPTETDQGDGVSGSLKVVVENEDGTDTDDQSDTSSDTGDGTEEKPIVTADLPDKDAVADIVLDDDEKEKLANGSNIIIRLKVDDNKKQQPTEEEDPGLDDLLKKLKNEAGDGKNSVFKTFVDLTLEKKIDDEDWQRILASNGKIEVVVQIPEAYVLGAQRMVLAKADGSEYIIMEDLDDDLNTITIMTDDFDSEYVLISIEDEATPLAVLESNCFWHWFILLTALIYLILILLTLKKKEKDDDDETAENSEKQRKDEAEESLEKQAKKSRNRRWLAMLAFAIALFIFTWLGTCRLEIIFDIITGIVVGGSEYGAYRHKFKELKDDESGEKKSTH